MKIEDATRLMGCVEDKGTKLQVKRIKMHCEKDQGPNCEN